MKSLSLRFLVCVSLLPAFSGCRPSAKPEASAKVDFNRDIQPILAERCYHCHGPDSGSRKSGLRLDLAETAFAKRPGKADAIVPGKPDESELCRRIAAQDDGVMPPRNAVEKPLSPEQIDLLRRWIAQGAHYRPHWAFEKPSRPPVPAAPAGAAVVNPIDNFVLAKLAEQGLKPNAEAGRAELIRRVTLDLTGLLPTPAETDAFVVDKAPDAYAKVVERLLASTAYGEQRARYWLDYARYGDTHGIHVDNYRSIWPYRDYVIRSLNANKPFDRFVREQIAGDMSAPENIDAIVATGYVRAGIASGEGGTLVEELRANNKRERAESYGATFLGLTVGCANCHDHKFDPVTQKDFFALTAYFNNIEEPPSTQDRADWAPNILVPKAENLAAYNATLAKKAVLLKELDARRLDAKALVAGWVAKGVKPEPVPEAGLKVRLRLDENTGAELRNSAPDTDLKRVVASGGTPQWGEETWAWPTFRMETSTRIEIPALGDTAKNEPFSVGAWFMPRFESYGPNTTKQGCILSRMDARDGNRGWELALAGDKLTFNLIGRDSEDKISVSTAQPALKHGRRNHVFATYDGSGKASGVKLYIDGKLAETVVHKDALQGEIRTKAPFQLGRRSPDDSPLRDGRYQDLRYYARCLPPEEAVRVAYADRVAEVLRKPADAWNEDEFKAVADYYFTNIDARSRELAAQLPAFDAELGRLSQGGDLTLVCKETTDLSYADVLARGAYTDRLERVRPAVPHFLPQPPADAPKDRRALAEWTVSPENPLTARVSVNRMWGELFGTGIVETADDFGIMGARPVNPELLDWLAVDFRESGWDMKATYRKMVMSAAYRRAAKTTPEMLEKDPANRFLARGPRYRMDAEMLRDTALQAAGLLSPKIGGPSVKPYQPSGIWEGVAYTSSNTRHYKQDSGESLYRKSLYTFRKRQAINPAQETLDSPVLDAVCVRRVRTNTPLQALVAMNDPQWVEASRFLAERTIREGGATTDTRLDFLARTLLGKAPSPLMRKTLSGSLAKFLKHYEAKPADADALLTVGEKPRDPALKPVEIAAWTLVASQMLNLDSTLNK